MEAGLVTAAGMRRERTLQSLKACCEADIRAGRHVGRFEPLVSDGALCTNVSFERASLLWCSY